jgi:small GTP-binding protein
LTLQLGDLEVAAGSQKPQQLNLPFFKMETYKLVVFGSGGVGKSALTIQLVQGRFVIAYDPTIEDSYKKTILVDGVEVSLDILDTAGQDDFKSLRQTYMRTGKGFLLVFALNDIASFDAIETYQRDIQQTAERDDVPIVVCGNKSDRPDRTVKREDAEKFCAESHLTYFETSGKNNVNVTEAFTELTRQMRAQNPDRAAAPSGAPDPGPAAEPGPGGSGGCCEIA